MMPKETRSKILAEYLENKISINSLAQKYCVNRNTISALLRKNAVKTAYFTELPEQEIIELYVNKRWSKERVASFFKVSISPIKKILIRNGYKIRNSSQCHLGQQAWNKGKVWSQEIRDKISEKAELRVGDKNSNWRGGNRPKYDGRRNWRIVKEWRSACLERDEKCLWCNATEFLEVNHIIPIRQIKDMELLADMNNGITLCRNCHKKIFRKEHKFVDIFHNLLIKSREFRETPTGNKDIPGQS